MDIMLVVMYQQQIRGTFTFKQQKKKEFIMEMVSVTYTLLINMLTFFLSVHVHQSMMCFN